MSQSYEDQQLSDKQIELGLDSENNQIVEKFKDNRPYDNSQHEESSYLFDKLKKYIKSQYGLTDKSFDSYIYSMKIKASSTNVKQIKMAIADTGGYINDFVISQKGGWFMISPRAVDQYIIDKAAALRKTLGC